MAEKQGRCKAAKGPRAVSGHVAAHLRESTLTNSLPG